MRTEVITRDRAEDYRAEVARVAGALRAGALVVFPTETVYGLGANAALPEAMARLRAAKGRNDQPFTVHIGQPAEARRYVPDAPVLVRRLARRGWPGPLTLVCAVADPTKAEIAEVTPPAQLAEIYHAGTVGLRCPDHPTARELLVEAGVPVVASSANRTGQPPPMDCAEALRDLDGVADHALDGGPTPLRGASTIVEVRGRQWRLLRQGVLAERTIERMARSEVLFVCTGNSCRSPLAEYVFRARLAEALGVALGELAEEGYVVSSAGTFAPAGGPASAGTLEELRRRGIDGSAHRSQPVTPELLQRADRIYVMTSEHRDEVLDVAPGAARRVELLDSKGSIADPVGQGPEAYRVCAEQIERAVAARLQEYLHEDRSW